MDKVHDLKSGKPVESADMTKELTEKLPEMLGSTSMQMALLTVMIEVGLILKPDLKAKDPESYYGMKSRIREFITKADKGVSDLRALVARME